jgi:hypothetical protein
MLENKYSEERRCNIADNHCKEAQSGEFAKSNVGLFPIHSADLR